MFTSLDLYHLFRLLVSFMASNAIGTFTRLGNVSWLNLIFLL